VSTLTDGINEWAATRTSASRSRPPLLYFLGFVMAIFIGILIFCYVVTKRTNPVFLDEHGKPVNSQSAHTGH
jgi:heme/copper-type cytochrome/quinol oxidase subunit 4